MAIRIDVVVVVIDRGDESGAFIPFVGMPIAPCFKARGYYHAHKFLLTKYLNIHHTKYEHIGVA